MLSVSVVDGFGVVLVDGGIADGFTVLCVCVFFVSVLRSDLLAFIDVVVALCRPCCCLLLLLPLLPHFASAAPVEENSLPGTTFFSEPFLFILPAIEGHYDSRKNTA